MPFVPTRHQRCYVYEFVCEIRALLKLEMNVRLTSAGLHLLVMRQVQRAYICHSNRKLVIAVTAAVIL